MRPQFRRPSGFARVRLGAQAIRFVVTLLKFVVFIPVMMAVVTFTALYLFLPDMRTSLSEEAAIIYWVSLVAIGAAIAGIRFFDQWYSRLEQEVRDRNASILAFNPSFFSVPFFLYLRPFVSTNRVAISRAQRVSSFLWLYVLGLFIPFVQLWAYAKLGGGRRELETKLRFGTEAFGPLVALGKQGEHIGAGRIETADEGWQAVILDLIKRSQYIFLVPHENAGTAWEVQQILSDADLVKKTIVIDTPSIDSGNFGKFVVEKTWPLMQKQFRDFGYNLPNHRRAGAIYSFSADGGLELDAKFYPWDRGGKIRETIAILDAKRSAQEMKQAV